MDALRRTITRYANHLDIQAKRHARFASVLRAVAHRLRHILDNNPKPPTNTEYGYLRDGRIHHLEELGSNEDKTARLYRREVTEWEEML